MPISGLNPRNASLRACHPFAEAFVRLAMLPRQIFHSPRTEFSKNIMAVLIDYFRSISKNPPSAFQFRINFQSEPDWPLRFILETNDKSKTVSSNKKRQPKCVGMTKTRAGVGVNDKNNYKINAEVSALDFVYSWQSARKHFYSFFVFILHRYSWELRSFVLIFCFFFIKKKEKLINQTSSC